MMASLPSPHDRAAVKNVRRLVLDAVQVETDGDPNTSKACTTDALRCLAELGRAGRIAALEALDPNGDFSDEARAAQGLDPLTDAEVLALALVLVGIVEKIEPQRP